MPTPTLPTSPHANEGMHFQRQVEAKRRDGERQAAELQRLRRKWQWSKDMVKRGGDGKLLPLSLQQISEFSRASCLHPDIMGPFRRAAARLDWYILIRVVNPDSMDYYAEFGKVPKPPGLYSKVDKTGTGVVRVGSGGLADEVAANRITANVLESRGLHEDDMGVVRDNKGRSFYSDPDLLDVFDVAGYWVDMGRGAQESEPTGEANRRKLDALVNVLHEEGSDYYMIQHGAQRQWIKHKKMGGDKNEWVSVFCPDGRLFMIYEVNALQQWYRAEFGRELETAEQSLA